MAGKVISRFQSGSGIHLISSTFYGTCDTAANTQVKQVKINDEHITELKLIPGMLLSVKFTNGNTATTNLQLEILDSTNNVLKNAVSITPNILTWGAGEVILFIYDKDNNNNEQWISNYLSTSGGNISGDITVANNIIANKFNGFKGRVSLTTTDNIDTLFETGVYYIQSTGAGGTFPSGTTGAYGSLISIGGHPSSESADSWVGKQVLILGSTLYVRSYAGSPRAWSAWGEYKPYSAPTQTSTASSIFTPASGVTVTGAYYTTNGIMAQVYLTLSRSSAISANTEVTLGSIVDGKRPKQQVNGGFSTLSSQYGNVRLLAGGDVRVRLTAQIAADTSFTIIFPAYMLP